VGSEYFRLAGLSIVQKLIIFLLTFSVIAFALARASARRKSSWTKQLKGWHKFFWIVAVLLTLLIVLNPEFVALGLLGDAAFFDLLVFALSLQLHTYFTGFCRRLVKMLTRGLRCLKIPSPGLSYLLGVSGVAIASAISAVQKAVHRIFS
jgi:hypothetical protein